VGEVVLVGVLVPVCVLVVVGELVLVAVLVRVLVVETVLVGVLVSDRVLEAVLDLEIVLVEVSEKTKEHTRKRTFHSKANPCHVIQNELWVHWSSVIGHLFFGFFVLECARGVLFSEIKIPVLVEVRVRVGVRVEVPEDRWRGSYPPAVMFIILKFPDSGVSLNGSSRVSSVPLLVPQLKLGRFAKNRHLHHLAKSE
jgi:hypothetical protein